MSDLKKGMLFQINKKFIFSILIIFLINYNQVYSNNSEHIKTPKIKKKIINKTLWKKGEGIYNNYRIPSLIVSKKGTLLAFAEGREAGDTGDIDVLLKISYDNGLSWSDEKIILDDAYNTIGNPTPVVDFQSGRIWLFTTWNNGKDNESQIINKTSLSPRKPYSCYSDDDGITWSKPVDMSTNLGDDSWGWYATGPGIGIQIKNGKYKDRLLIPANHSYDDTKGKIRGGPFSYGSHVIYSDDYGKSWKKSSSIRPGCNESQIVELNNGYLMMNMRSYNNKYSRAISISSDGGQTWSEIHHDYQLVESRCQASVLNYGNHNGNKLHIFSNPSVPIGRTNMTIKISFDDCKSWNVSKQIYSGFSAYSCLTKLPNGNIGLLFEMGGGKDDNNSKDLRYNKMVFLSIPIEVIFSDNEIKL